MNKHELSLQLSLGESSTVEFKTRPILRSVGSSICAFLNGRGGFVVCGMADDLTVIGVKSAEKAVTKLTAELAAAITPAALISLEVQELENKELVVIEVPAGKDIPYAITNSIYVRKNDRTVKANVDTVRDMVMRKQVEPERWERRFSALADEEDLSLSAMKQLFDAYQQASGNPQFLEGGLFHRLEQLSLAKYSRLTNAGDILLSSHPAQRHPQARVRAVCYTKKTDDDYQDLQHFDGPLTAVLEKMLHFIERNTPTRARFSKASAQREDVPLYPKMALREGLVNAFSHRDYANFSGGIKVEVSPEKVEIWNSGGLPEGMDAAKLAAGHISILRNPDIAHMLYIMGYMEKLGRGSLLIRRLCQEAGLAEPVWSAEPNLGVTLTFAALAGTGKIVQQMQGEDSGTEATLQASQHAGLQVSHHVTLQVRKLINALRSSELSRSNLMDQIGIKDRVTFSKNYLNPALDAELVERTMPNSPRSPTQKYRLTSKGRLLLSSDEMPSLEQDI